MAFWCTAKRDFWADFSENMTALNLPVPKNLFDSATTAVVNLVAITVFVEKMGTATTVAELVGAGLLSEVALGVGAVLASAYVGGLIGSFIVASKNDLTCGIDLFDAMQIIKAAGISSPWIYLHLAKNPQLYDGTGGMVGPPNYRRKP